MTNKNKIKKFLSLKIGIHLVSTWYSLGIHLVSTWYPLGAPILGAEIPTSSDFFLSTSKQTGLFKTSNICFQNSRILVSVFFEVVRTRVQLSEKNRLMKVFGPSHRKRKSQVNCEIDFTFFFELGPSVNIIMEQRILSNTKVTIEKR